MSSTKSTTSTTARVTNAQVMAEMAAIRALLVERFGAATVEAPKGVSLTKATKAPKALTKAEQAAKAAKATERAEQKALYLANKAKNQAQAAWMREKGLVPSGQAWTAVKHGERGVKALKALNVADGLVPLVKAPKAEIKVEVKAQAPAKAPSMSPTPKARRGKAKADTTGLTSEQMALVNSPTGLQLQAMGVPADRILAALDA